MIKGRLTMALDFGKKRGAKEEHGKVSWQDADGTWYVRIPWRPYVNGQGGIADQMKACAE